MDEWRCKGITVFPLSCPRWTLHVEWCTHTRVRTNHPAPGTASGHTHPTHSVSRRIKRNTSEPHPLCMSSMFMHASLCLFCASQNMHFYICGSMTYNIRKSLLTLPLWSYISTWAPRASLLWHIRTCLFVSLEAALRSPDKLKKVHVCHGATIYLS